MDKKEEFLNKLAKIEPKIRKYHHYMNDKFSSKLIRVFIVGKKSILKGYSILIEKIFNKDFKKEVKTFWGRSLEVYLADRMSSGLYFFGVLHGEELKIVKFLIKNFKENDNFYDIGVNYGFYTLLAQEFITKGEIHAFEPLPKIFEILEKNAQIKKFKNTFLNQIALYDKNGEIEFYAPTSTFNTGDGSLIPHKKCNKRFKTIRVLTQKLDSYILNHQPPTIMKIDVEGAEPYVLRGGCNLIKNFQPIIIMEYGNDNLHNEAVSFLLKNGYKIFKLTEEGNLVLLDDNEIQKIFDGKVKPEANYVFKK